MGIDVCSGFRHNLLGLWFLLNLKNGLRGLRTVNKRIQTHLLFLFLSTFFSTCLLLLVLLWALVFVFTSRGSRENREGKKDFDLRDMLDREVYAQRP